MSETFLFFLRFICFQLIHVRNMSWQRNFTVAIPIFPWSARIYELWIILSHFIVCVLFITNSTGIQDWIVFKWIRFIIITAGVIKCLPDFANQNVLFWLCLRVNLRVQYLQLNGFVVAYGWLRCVTDLKKDSELFLATSSNSLQLAIHFRYYPQFLWPE